MIKKVSNINLVPADLQELIVPEKGEYVAIGKNVYEMFPFSITQYLMLLNFIGEYFSTYNDIYSENETMKTTEFFGILAGKILEENLLSKLFVLFPDITDDLAMITKDQLVHLLGIIYKLNFLVKKNPIGNLQTRLSVNKMLEMLGLSMLKSD